MRISSGTRQKTLSDAWRCGGIGRSARQPKRAQARSVYAQSYWGTPAGAGLATSIAHPIETDEMIAPRASSAARLGHAQRGLLQQSHLLIQEIERPASQLA
jgi:hypothetical protein